MSLGQQSASMEQNSQPCHKRFRCCGTNKCAQRTSFTLNQGEARQTWLAYVAVQHVSPHTLCSIMPSLFFQTIKASIISAAFEHCSVYSGHFSPTSDEIVSATSSSLYKWSKTPMLSNQRSGLVPRVNWRWCEIHSVFLLHIAASPRSYRIICLFGGVWSMLQKLNKVPTRLRSERVALSSYTNIVPSTEEYLSTMQDSVSRVPADSFCRWTENISSYVCIGELFVRKTRDEEGFGTS